MTIRYTCEKCGSVLKIREDRAGKEGHCPKCKSAFIVPSAEEAAAQEQAAESSAEAATSAGAAEPPTSGETEKSAAAQGQVVKAKSQATPAATAEESPRSADKTNSPAPVAKAGASAKDAAAPAAAKGEPASEARTSASKDDDFDPVAFLMTDEPAGSKGSGGKQAPAATGGAAPDMRVKRGAASAGYTSSDEPDVRVGGPRPAATAEDDEELEAQLLRRRPKRSASPPSASQTADEMLRVNAAASSAKELMTKTVEESRIRAAQMPEERGKPGIDYKETARELGLRFAPAVVGTVLVVLLAYWFGMWMSGGGLSLPDLGYVSGTVTKNGEPLVGAKVTFTPVDIKAGTASAYTDENGRYELKYTEGIEGVVLGKNKVQVSLVGPNGREVVAPMTPYGQGSNNVETVEEGSQTIDINIP